MLCTYKQEKKVTVLIARSYKYVEQLFFSGLPSFAVLGAGYAMSVEDFYLFSLSFSVLQGLMVVLFSYESSPILVFQQKHSASNSVYFTFKLISSTAVTAILVAIAWLYLSSKFLLDFGFAVVFASCTLLWVFYDVIRKFMFARVLYLRACFLLFLI